MLSDRAHFTERLRLLDEDDVEDQLTIEDPIALAKPWLLTLNFKRVREMNRLLPTTAPRTSAILSLMER